MLPRERVQACLNFEPPDVAVLELHPSTAGLYEHGDKLLALMRDHSHDFGDYSGLQLPQVNPDTIQEDGTYCEIRTDPWGVTWKHLIYGAWGHPLERPLDDWSKLSSYRAPAPPEPSGEAFEAAKQSAAKHRETYYLKGGWGGIFETLIGVRRFEDVLMDIALNTREINYLTDMICEYQEEVLRYVLAVGCDGIQMGDDFGTQESLLLSRESWLRFFKPRYERLLRPALEAGVTVFFHSCGLVCELLEDLSDLGVRAIWPQINLYNWPEMAKRCKDLNLTIALHPERSHVMTFGTPADVRRHIKGLGDAFRPQEGGSWWYLEIDNGFPWENVEALFEAVGEYR